MLSAEERSEVVAALTYWANAVPDQPVIGFLDGHEFLTPTEVVAAIRDTTSDGEAILEMLEFGVRREGLKCVVGRFRGVTRLKR